MTGSESKQQLLHDLGATPVITDALDRESVAQAVAKAEHRHCATCEGQPICRALSRCQRANL